MPERVPSQLELRLVVAKILELSYRTNSGLTVALMRQAGRVSVSVDHNGRATISGRAGTVAFSVTEATRELGMSVRAITILMSADGNGEIRYNAQFRFALAMVGIQGSIDVEKLVLSCSGFLCIAARALKGRSAQLDRERLNAMGD